MTEKKKLFIIISAAVLLLLCLALVLFLVLRKTPDEPEPTPPSAEPQKIEVLMQGASQMNYSIVYSEGSVNYKDRVSDIVAHIMVNLGYNGTLTKDNCSNLQESTNEILIGATDRQLSAELISAVNAANISGQDLVWGYMYKDGKLAFYASSEAALEYGWSEFMSAVCKNDGIYFMSDLNEIGIKTYEEYMEDKRKEDEAAAQEALKLYNEKLQYFRASSSKFNAVDSGTLTAFPAPYGDAQVIPTGDRPRLWVNSQTLQTVIENINSSENAIYYTKVKNIADRAIAEGDVGKLPDTDANFTADALGKMESLAFMYLVTGDKLYGVAAVAHALNFLDTVKFSTDSNVAYQNNNNAGAAMHSLSMVYDWCNEFIMPKQKSFFVINVCNKLGELMEVGCPPKGLGSITGHGTGLQLLRNWVSFAIATYDEYPEIYNNVVGRLLNEYLEAPNWYYSAGTHHQGTSYSCIKVACHTMNDMLIYYATGKHIYDVEFEETIMSYLYRIRPDGESIRVGDDVNSHGPTYPLYYHAYVSYFAGSYYGNSVAKAWYNSFSYEPTWSGDYSISPVLWLLTNDPSVKATDTDKYTLELVKYSGEPISTLIARSAWDDTDAWMTYTAMEEVYAANHDHKDAGTFQIYYKGILAPDAAAYQMKRDSDVNDQDYNSLYDIAYVKQTVSKNGLLIYNPQYENMRLEAAEYGKIWDNTTDAWLSADGKFYFDTATGTWRYNAQYNKKGIWSYTGGQTTQGSSVLENTTLDEWLSKSTSNETVSLGKAYGYDSDGNVKYAYIAGDITGAYDSDTVDSVTRSTITLSTGNEAHPMVFIVYDRITSDDASYKKSFVLHTMNKPTFVGDSVIETEPQAPDYSNVSSTVPPQVYDGFTYVTGTNTFYYDNTLGASGHYAEDIADDKYNGQLTTTTLLPKNATYRYIGGDDQRAWVNGMNVMDESGNTLDIRVAAEIGWGRVEISPTVSNYTDSFLNVMYVGDAGDNDIIESMLVEGCTTHEGVISFGNVVMFAKNANVNETVTFTASGEGNMNYYITGLSEGRWSVTVGGRAISDNGFEVSRDEGMLTFCAQAGEEVVITPEFEKLTLVLNGGKETSYIPPIYYPNEDFELPTNVEIERFAYEFKGWYDNPELKGTPVSVIPDGTFGEQTFYAAWEKVFGVIQYELRRGAFVSGYSAPIENKVGILITLPTAENITKENCEFVGWYTTPTFDEGSEIFEIPAENVNDYVLYARFTGPESLSLNQSGTWVYPLGETAALGYWMSEAGTSKFVLHVDTASEGNSGWDPTGNAGFRLFNSMTDMSKNDTYQIYILNFGNNMMTTYKKSPLININSGDIVDVVVDIGEKSLEYYVNGTFVVKETVGGTSAFATDLTYYDSHKSTTYDKSVYKQHGNIQGPLNLIGNGERVLAWDEISVYIGGEIPTKEPEDAQPLVLNTNGGSIVGSKPLVYLNSNDFALPATLEKEGWTFAGWYDNEALTGDPVTEIPAGTTGEQVYYAKWEKAYGVISYYLNGGTTEETLIRENYNGTAVSLPTQLLKDGFTFEGWYTDQAYTDNVTEIPAEGMDDISLYAKFSGALYHSENRVENNLYPITDSYFGSAVLADGNGVFTIHLDTAASGNAGWDDGSQWGGASLRLFNPLQSLSNPKNYEIKLIHFVDGVMMTSTRKVALMEINSGKTLDLVVDILNKRLDYYIDGEFIVTENVADSAMSDNLHEYNCPKVGYDKSLYQQNGGIQGPLNLIGNGTRFLAWDEFTINAGDIISGSSTQS